MDHAAGPFELSAMEDIKGSYERQAAINLYIQYVKEFRLVIRPSLAHAVLEDPIGNNWSGLSWVPLINLPWANISKLDSRTCMPHIKPVFDEI